MSTESEKRLHRCCFSGHRPEKLPAGEEAVKQWLSQQIKAAVSAGYRTFLCGMGMGVDIWAGQIVVERRRENRELRLVCAVPWPGFSNRWSVEWKEQYSALLREADLVVPVSHQYKDDVFQKRNRWLVDHSSRLIAFYNGEPVGTWDTVEYALGQKVRVFTNIPVFKNDKGRTREIVMGVQNENDSGETSRPYTAPGRSRIPYPENLLTAIGLERVFGKNEYIPLNADQLQGLEHILDLLEERDSIILRWRFQEGKPQQECGKTLSITYQRVAQIEQRALGELRHPYRLAFIRDGFAKTELALKIRCAEEMKRCLAEQKKQYPLMNEEDVVKFAFQGMLGVGHLVSSEETALEYLRKEMDSLEPDMEEPLVEKISSDWLRINLRAAKARGQMAEELAYMLFRSAQMHPLSFARQNVYNFCVKLDGSEKMRVAATRVLDENWLPRHSEAYREAYAPAYRVMHKDYRKFRRGTEDTERDGHV